MVKLKEALPLINDRTYFEKIHTIKSHFIDLFSNLGNRLSATGLEEVHHVYKGIKISKGNELHHCPYQVLDLVRDFDKITGFNIRILHWWGRGLFILVYFGSKNPFLINSNHFLSYIKEKKYLLSRTSSPWSYGEMIDGGNKILIGDKTTLIEHQKKFRHLQFFHRVEYEEEYHLMEEALYEELKTLRHLIIKDSN